MTTPKLKFNFQRRPTVEFDDCCLGKDQFYTNCDQQLLNVEINGLKLAIRDTNSLSPDEFLCLLRNILNRISPDAKKHHFSSDEVYLRNLPALFEFLGADVEVSYEDKTLTRQDVLNDHKNNRITTAHAERLLDLLSQGRAITLEE